MKQALPCNCDDITTFENPELLPCNDKAFVMSNAQIGGGTGTAKVFGKIKGAGGIIATIMLKTETGIQQDSTLLDDNGEWEIKSLPAGSYSLDLDFHAIFEENNYSFDNDGKIEAITLTDSQVLEITAQVKKG